MGTITVSTITTEAAGLLKDSGMVRWTLPMLTKWLNDAQLVIATLKPSASTKNVAVQLVAGTKQTLPTDGVQLIDIVRNMGSGTTPGKAIRIASREIFDAVLPDWHTVNAESVVQNYLYDKQDPKTYYVYPPQPSTPTYVEMIYSCVPTTSTTTITLDDVFAPAIVEYIMHRAYTKDGEYEGNVTLAERHWQAFLNMILGKAKSEAVNNPNSTAPANPKEPVIVS